MYLVLAAFVCEHPQPPTPPPQERCSYDKAKYEECTEEGRGGHEVNDEGTRMAGVGVEVGAVAERHRVGWSW